METMFKFQRKAIFSRIFLPALSTSIQSWTKCAVQIILDKYVPKPTHVLSAKFADLLHEDHR